MYIWKMNLLLFELHLNFHLLFIMFIMFGYSDGFYCSVIAVQCRKTINRIPSPLVHKWYYVDTKQNIMCDMRIGWWAKHRVQWMKLNQINAILPAIHVTCWSANRKGKYFICYFYNKRVTHTDTLTLTSSTITIIIVMIIIHLAIATTWCFSLCLLLTLRADTQIYICNRHSAMERTMHEKKRREITKRK